MITPSEEREARSKAQSGRVDGGGEVESFKPSSVARFYASALRAAITRRLAEFFQSETLATAKN